MTKLNLIICMSLAMLCACRDQEGSKETSSPRPEISQNGAMIQLKQKPADGVFQTIQVGFQAAQTSLTYPAQGMVRIQSSALGQGVPHLIFANPDHAGLYSSLVQNRIAALKAQKNLEDLRQLYEHQGAVHKDLLDAQSDLQTAQTQVTEFESRMISIGLDPSVLERVKSNSLLLLVDLPEQILPNLKKPSRTLQVEFQAFPNRQFVGQILKLTSVLDPQLRTVKLLISVNDPQDELHPGQFAQVSIPNQNSQSIVIPNDALISVQDKDYVFVQTGDLKFERRNLLNVRQIGDQFAVNGDLKIGDRIVTTGAILLKGLSFGY